MFDSETEHFTYTRIVQTPTVEPVEKLVGIDGWNNAYDYLYFETTPDGRFLSSLVIKGETSRLNDSTQWDVEYDPGDKKFYDVGTSTPHKWGVDNTSTNLATFPTAANLETYCWYDDSGDFKFRFDNPYYVAPPPLPPTTLAITKWTVNSDASTPKRFEYQSSHIDNNPTNHVYIYQAYLGTYTNADFTIQFRNDATLGLGWYDHGNNNPSNTNFGNRSVLSTSWDGGNDNCLVQNDEFFINYG